MRKPALSLGTCLHFALYFACLMAIGLWVRDIPFQPSLSATIHTFTQGLQMGDPGSFASGALDVYRNGWFTPPNRWLIHLWPPGFMLLEAAILRVFGEQAPFITILLVLSALLHSYMMTLLRHILLSMVPAAAASLLPLVPFCFPVTRQFLLEPTGLILGEAFAAGFYLSSVLLIFLAVRKQRLSLAIFGGLLLALSAYFRSQYGTIAMMTTLGALPLLLWLALKARQTNVQAPLRHQIVFSMKTLLLALVAANALMLPWRIHNKLEGGKTTWVYTQETMAVGSLSRTEDLLKVGGEWIVVGGGNMACIVAPEYCGKKDPGLFYRAFFEHPGEWILRKAALLDDYWFNSILDWTNPKSAQSIGDWIANSVMLAYLLAIAPLLWLTRRHPESSVLVWLFGSFFLCYCAIFTLAHFETRYFYLIKIFATVGTTLMASMAWNRWRTRDKSGFGTEAQA